MHPHLYFEAAAQHRVDLEAEAGRYRRLSRRTRKARARTRHAAGVPGLVLPART
jgi:hypothetical protein